MKTLIEFVNTASETWWSNVFHATWQAAIVGGILLAVTFLGRRWPAPLRYGLLLLALIKFAFPPMLSVPTGLFSAVGPALTWPEKHPRVSEVPIWSTPLPTVPSPPEPAFAFSEIVDEVTNLALKTKPSGNSAIGESRELLPAIHWKSWLMLVHLGGFVAVLLWIGWQLIQLRRITRHAGLIKAGELSAEFAGVSRQLGLRRLPRLMVSSEVHAPIAFGLLRPTVMLPSSVVQKLPMAEIRTILAHELAHYRRSDLWINWLQLILLAAWWFNPVFWLMSRAIRKVREDCCDDLLLARGLTSSDAYCDVLIRAAAELTGKVPAGATLGFAEDIHPLGRRVARIMDHTIRRYHKVSALGVLLLLALGGLLLPGLKSQTAERGHLFSAKGAVSFQPGATPQENAKSQNSGLKVRPIVPAIDRLPPAVNRAFSAVDSKRHASWGVAPGWNNDAPLALNTYERGSQPTPGPSPVSSLRAGSTLEPTSAERDSAGEAAASEALKRIQGSGKPETQPRSAAELFKQLTIRGNGLKRSQAELLNEFLRSPSVVPFLIQQLANQTSPNKVEAAKSRSKAAWLLSEIRIAAKPAIPALVKVLEDDDQSAAQCAADALGALGSEAKETIPALIESLKLENHGAASALVKIAPESPQVATALIEAFEGKSYPFRQQLLFSMSDLKAEKERLERTLIAAQQEPEADIRSTSAFALSRIGAKSPEALAAIKAWQRENVVSRDQAPMTLRESIEKLKDRKIGADELKAIHQLTQMGPDAAEAVPALVSYLSDPKAPSRANVALALGAIGPAAKEAVPALIAFFKDPANHGRANAVSALGAIGAAAKEAVPTLIDALNEDNMGVRCNAARALGLIGPDAKAAIPLLQKAIKDWDQRLRLQAATSLWRLDPSFIPTCVPILIQFLERPPKELGNLSYFLSKELGQIGPPAKEALPALVRVFEGPEDFGRWTAVSAICRIDPGESSKYISQMIRILEDQSSTHRSAVAYSLGDMGQMAKAAVPALKAASTDSDPRLQSEAIKALAKISRSGN